MMSKGVACQGTRRSMRRPDENDDEAEKTDTETATLMSMGRSDDGRGTYVDEKSGQGGMCAFPKSTNARGGTK
jgi:hypothetical protein